MPELDRPVPLQETETKRFSQQEAQYVFPYHHIPRLDDCGFRQSIALRWGYLYISYLEFVLATLAKLPFSSLLDVGCGDGRLVREVKDRFADVRVLGVDASQRAIEIARAMTPRAEFVAGDVTDPACASGPFDVITLIEVLEHLPPESTPRFVGALASRLADSGRLVVTVPTPNVGLHAKHYRHFELQDLEKALAPVFSIREAFFLNRRSRVAKTLDRLLTNRFYAVRHPRLLSGFLALYRRRWLEATPQSAMRICAVLERTA